MDRMMRAPAALGAIITMLIATSSARAQFAHVNAKRIMTDEELGNTWMVDRHRQAILTQSEYRAKLEKISASLENEVDTEIRQRKPCVTAALKLIEIYRELGTTEKIDHVAKRVEAAGFALESLYIRNKDTPKLLQAWRQAYEHKKNTLHPSEKWTQLARIGDLYYQLGNISKAESCYIQAKTISMSLREALGREAPAKTKLVCIGPFYTLACFLARQGRFEEAAREMRKTLPYLDPKNNCDFEVGFNGCDDLETFLVLLKGRNDSLYREFFEHWKNINKRTAFAGLLSVEGKEITGPDFRNIENFSDGVAAATDIFSHKIGYIDRVGNWAIKPQFMQAKDFSKGLATAVLAPQSWPAKPLEYFADLAIIDKTGKPFKKLDAVTASEFQGSTCITGSENWLSRTTVSHLVDRSGETLFTGVFGVVKPSIKDDLTLAITTGTWQRGCVGTPIGFLLTATVVPDPARPGHYKLIQKNCPARSAGTKLAEFELPFRLASAADTDEAQDGARITRGKNGYFLESRRNLKLSDSYCKLERLSEDRYAFYDNDMRAGIMNASGAVMIKPKYQSIEKFHDGVAIYKRPI